MKEVTLTSLEKANKILVKIKELDQDIIQLEGLAMILSNKKSSVKLTLEVTDLEKEDKKKKVLDEDGSINIRTLGEGLMESFRQHQLSHLQMYGNQVSSCYGFKQEGHKLNKTITDTAGLGILGVILGEYREERNQLLKQIQNLGIKIN